MMNMNANMPTGLMWSTKTPTMPHINADMEKEDDIKLFHQQLNDISNEIILGDIALVEFHEIPCTEPNRFKWINKGELVAGSFIMRLMNSTIHAQDIDIYFHSHADATEFADKNGCLMPPQDPQHPMCVKIYMYGALVNLIWGVQYDNARDLLAGFDIRACAMAFDPTDNKFILVDKAQDDALVRKIVYQTRARAITVRRLLKYIDKSFTINKYQRVIFAELIKSGKHKNDLELSTGY